GGKVVAAMRRVHPTNWRTNLARGAFAEPVSLTSEEESLSLQAAAALGAEVAGVDLLPGKDGRLFVIEVNGVPGWKGLSAATEIDIAALILNYVTTKQRDNS